MSYRNGVTTSEPPGKASQSRHYYNNNNNNFGESSSSFDLANNSNPMDCYQWGSRSSFSSRKISSLSENHNEKRNRSSSSWSKEDDEKQDGVVMDYYDNNDRLSSRKRRSQSPSLFNNNRTITLSSNMDIHHQKSGDKPAMHGRHWDTLRINIDNKQYQDSKHHGSFNSSRDSSSKNFPSDKWSKSKSREYSSRSSYYDSGNAGELSDQYESRVDDFLRDNLNALRHKSSKQRRDDSRHRNNSFSGSDYEHDRERREQSPSSYNRSDRDRYRANSSLGSKLRTSSSPPPRRISRSGLDDEDMVSYDDNRTSRGKSHERSRKEYKSRCQDESDSDRNIADSDSDSDIADPDMWDTLHRILKEQKQSGISRQIRDPITRNELGQGQDHTIKDILKSIGFDTEMSKRMEERAKQVSTIPEYLKTGKSSQSGQQGLPNMSTEMDKGLMERTQMQIFTIEKSLSSNINTSIPPPNITKHPVALPPPTCPPIQNRPPPNAVLSPVPTPTVMLSAGYGQIPLACSDMPHGVSYLPGQQPPFGAPYPNVQQPQFDYDSTNYLASASAPASSIPSNLRAAPSMIPKSDLPVPSATASASLPGSSWRDDRSPHSYKRHGSPKTSRWSPEREWSPRRSRSPPSRRDQSPPSPRSVHIRCYRSRKSRDRSPDSRMTRSKRDRSPLHTSHSPVSKRRRSPSWLDRERTPPKYDRSLRDMQRHSRSPSRYDSSSKGRSSKSKWCHKDSKHDADSNRERIGDSMRDCEHLSVSGIEGMKKVRLEYIDRVENFKNELNKICKQRNELMGKNQRVKDGHKDPLLLENANLQEEINSKISFLKKDVIDISKSLKASGVKLDQAYPYDESYSKHTKKSSASYPRSKSWSDNCFEEKSSKSTIGPLDKSPPPLRREISCESLQSSKSDPPFPLKRKMDYDQSKRLDHDSMLVSSSEDKSLSGQKQPPFPLRKSSLLPESSSAEAQTQEDENVASTSEVASNTSSKVDFEYFDPGNHWCSHCNTVCGNIYELFQHLQSKKHDAKLDHYDRPWLPESIRNPSNKPKLGQIQMAPIKGVEFLMSTTAFYCTMCKEFSGDALSVEAHLKSDSHNMAYKKYIQDVPFYEKRRNLDKAAGLQSYTSEKNVRQENNDDGDDEVRVLPKKSLQEITTGKLVKDEQNSQGPIKEETQIAKTMMKEESIEKPQKSVEESVNKEPESAIASSEGKDDSVKPVSEELFTKEEPSTREDKSEQPLPSVLKRKISIKLTGKTGIKPVQYPVVPTEIPVSKIYGPENRPRIKSNTRSKKTASNEIEEPLSLDDFLTFGDKGTVPVVSDTETLPAISSDSLSRDTENEEKQNSGNDVGDNVVDEPMPMCEPIVEPKDTQTKSTTDLDQPPPPPLSTGTIPVVSDTETSPAISSESLSRDTENEEKQNSGVDVVAELMPMCEPIVEPKDTQTKSTTDLDKPPSPPLSMPITISPSPS